MKLRSHLLRDVTRPDIKKLINMSSLVDHVCIECSNTHAYSKNLLIAEGSVGCVTTKGHADFT